MRPRDGRFESIAEEEAAREPRFEVSGVPSAGDGAPQALGASSGSARAAGAAPAAPGAQDGGAPLFIQTDRPWTVVLDSAGDTVTTTLGAIRFAPQLITS